VVNGHGCIVASRFVKSGAKPQRVLLTRSAKWLAEDSRRFLNERPRQPSFPWHDAFHHKGFPNRQKQNLIGLRCERQSRSSGTLSLIENDL
jgi:hypothetical protein